MDFLRQLFAGTLDAWRRLSASARINIALAAAGVIGVIVLVVLTTGQPEYVTVYSGLSPEDSAAVRSALTDQGIPHRIQRGGSTVLVPLSERDRVLVDLAAQSLPRNQGTTPGFEFVERTNLMTNQYLQDIQYRRAVQQQLQAQINQLDVVDASSVFIYEPERTLFTDEQEPSSAAVMVTVNRPPTEREVKAMLHTISSFGGANLDMNHITLTTTAGDPLHLPPEDDFIGVANSKLAYQKQVEDDRVRKAREALERIGVRSVVTLSADIDTESLEETREQVLPGAPVSTLTEETELTSRQSLPEGPPGLNQNLPPGGPQPVTTVTEETTTQEIENLEPSRITTRTVRTPGMVKAYKVAALVAPRFQPAVNADGEETGEQEPVSWAEADLEKFRGIIAAAVGVGVDTQDVMVAEHIFETPETPAAAAAAMAAQAPNPVMRLLQLKELWYILGLIVLLVAIRRILQGLIVPEEEMEVRKPEPPRLSPEEERQRRTVEAVEEFSERQPDTAAALIRTWLAEDREV